MSFRLTEQVVMKQFAVLIVISGWLVSRARVLVSSAKIAFLTEVSHVAVSLNPALALLDLDSAAI